MTEEMITEQVLTILRQRLHQEELQLTPETRFQEDLEVDSIAFMEIIIAMEDHFQLAISDEDAEHLSTLSDVVAYLKRRLDNSGIGW